MQPRVSLWLLWLREGWRQLRFRAFSFLHSFFRSPLFKTRVEQIIYFPVSLQAGRQAVRDDVRVLVWEKEPTIGKLFIFLSFSQSEGFREQAATSSTVGGSCWHTAVTSSSSTPSPPPSPDLFSKSSSCSACRVFHVWSRRGTFCYTPTFNCLTVSVCPCCCCCCSCSCIL